MAVDASANPVSVSPNPAPPPPSRVVQNGKRYLPSTAVVRDATRYKDARSHVMYIAAEAKEYPHRAHVMGCYEMGKKARTEAANAILPGFDGALETTKETLQTEKEKIIKLPNFASRVEDLVQSGGLPRRLALLVALQAELIIRPNQRGSERAASKLDMAFKPVAKSLGFDHPPEAFLRAEMSTVYSLREDNLSKLLDPLGWSLGSEEGTSSVSLTLIQSLVLKDVLHKISDIAAQVSAAEEDTSSSGDHDYRAEGQTCPGASSSTLQRWQAVHKIMGHLDHHVRAQKTLLRVLTRVWSESDKTTADNLTQLALTCARLMEKMDRFLLNDGDGNLETQGERLQNALLTEWKNGSNHERHVVIQSMDPLAPRDGSQMVDPNQQNVTYEINDIERAQLDDDFKDFVERLSYRYQTAYHARRTLELMGLANQCNNQAAEMVTARTYRDAFLGSLQALVLGTIKPQVPTATEHPPAVTGKSDSSAPIIPPAIGAAATQAILQGLLMGVGPIKHVLENRHPILQQSPGFLGIVIFLAAYYFLLKPPLERRAARHMHLPGLEYQYFHDLAVVHGVHLARILCGFYSGIAKNYARLLEGDPSKEQGKSKDSQPNGGGGEQSGGEGEESEPNEATSGKPKAAS